MITAYRYFTVPIEKLTADAERKFFAGIRLANKTFKTTVSGRMPDLDALTIRLVRDFGWQAPVVMDVGVSSGATTVDLLEAMRANGLEPKITATDLTFGATIFEIAPGVRLLADAHGNSLQYEFHGRGLRAWTRRLDAVTGYSLLTQTVQRFVASRAKKRVMDVKLVSRLRTVSANQAIEFVEDELAVRNPRFESRFDIARAANLLNRSYFDSARLRVMIDNLKSYVRRPDGLLVINRTHEDGTNHGTIFRLDTGEVQVVERVGGGSEIESLVTG